MFDDFLNHKCDIYHLETEKVEAGYGTRTGDTKTAQETAEVGVPCHFHRKNNTLRIVQSEPHSEVDGEVKLSLPAGTDIRKNDRVFDYETGIFYRAGLPKLIHGDHHIIVTITRETGVPNAI